MVVLMPLSPLQFVRFSLVGIKVFSLPPLFFSPLSPPAPLAFSIRHRKKEMKRFTVVVPSRIFFFLWKKKFKDCLYIFTIISPVSSAEKPIVQRDTNSQ